MYGGVLGANQFLSLSRPRHQFAVEGNPFRVQLFPKVRSGQSQSHPVEELRLQRRFVEESPARSGVNNSDLAFEYAEAFLGRVFVLADDHHRPRTHVFLW